MLFGKVKSLVLAYGKWQVELGIMLMAKGKFVTTLIEDKNHV